MAFKDMGRSVEPIDLDRDPRLLKVSGTIMSSGLGANRIDDTDLMDPLVHGSWKSRVGFRVYRALEISSRRRHRVQRPSCATTPQASRSLGKYRTLFSNSVWCGDPESRASALVTFGALIRPPNGSLDK
jgi:hypothetical protein